MILVTNAVLLFMTNSSQLVLTELAHTNHWGRGSCVVAMILRFDVSEGQGLALLADAILTHVI